jgi:Mn2+/Fe2+ NRAMP family transporter
MKKLKTLFASILPGIFLIGYNIGTGSLTAMSKAGANFGCDLLWAVLLSCLITWYLINFFSRFTMASGMTAMEGFRKHIHPAYAWVLWSGLSVIILSALMAMIGLLTDVVLVWFKELWAIDADRRVVGIVLALFVYGLILMGNTKRFEAMLSIMVALMGVAFIGAAIWFFPGFETVFKGFIPKLPAVAEGSDNGSMIILAGMVGTTVSVFAFLIRSGQVKDHGWTMKDWRLQKRDALVSASMMFVLSAAVMITATATLNAEGLKMNHIKEMIPMLKPVFGPSALFIFVVGIMAAGISSHLPNMMVIPWLTDDLQGSPRNVRTRQKRFVLGGLTLISILGVFMARPVFLLLLSQAGISLVMPMALLGLMYLSSRKEIVGDYRPKLAEWCLLSFIACFSLFMSAQALQGLVEDLRKSPLKTATPIVRSESAEPSEQWAATELANFLQELYPNDRFPVVKTAPAHGDYILLSGPSDSGVLKANIQPEEIDEPGEFVVKSIRTDEREIGIICGNTPRAVLDGVYSLLEQKLGFGFYLYRNASERAEKGAFSFDKWDLAAAPDYSERIIFNWYNFISGVTAWNLEDYKHWIRQAARMRHTDVMLHVYGWAPFTEFSHNGVTKEVEYLQNTAVGRHWMVEHTPDVRKLIGGEVFADEGPVFGADVSKVGYGGITEENRVEKAKAMLREVFDYAVNTVGLEFNWAFDIDTTYGNPQNIILTLPESARFPVGDFWLARPDTEAGYQFFRSMIKTTMDDFPAITKLTLWARNSRSSSFGGLTTGMTRDDLPSDWQPLYDEAPPEAQTPYSAGHIYHAKVAEAFRRALNELGHQNVELGFGSWWREDPAGEMVSDNFEPANWFMPQELTCYPLDYYMAFGKHENFRRELAKIAAKRNLVLLEWAHHDDGGYLGRPYQPPVNFADKLKETGVSGYGVIHWMTRPLDIFFKNVQNQVWSNTKNQTLRQTSDQMALDFFGNSQSEIMAGYLFDWMTTAPRFGRETGEDLGGDSSTKSNSNVDHFEERATGCDRRIAILDQVDTDKLSPQALETWKYFREHEEWIKLFHLAQKDWDPELQKQTIRKYVEKTSHDGGMTRGEKGILIQHNLKWLKTPEPNN